MTNINKSFRNHRIEPMASPVVRKSNKDEVNKEIVSMDEVAKDAKNFIERILGDVSKTSATKQLVIGSLSGW